jgi:hypothetical protein
MRGAVAAAAVFLALFAAPFAGAGSSPLSFGSSMTVAATPPVAGARGIRLSLTLHYFMQCGYAGAGPLVVTFPKGLKVPEQFPTGAITLAGKPVAANVDRRRVTVTVAPHKGMICDVMGRGSLTLAFSRAANLANPVRPGSYRFKATHRQHAFTAKLAIKAPS